ncbi:hypothetical protein JCGZ_08154 [Jatropha curcas]|uniref:Mechanosensitive ion channel protein n=1 Tax=Jatropha curcas TaxID=180498 RepID=A0A067KPD4_JATCU|nr:mechanosensitive ion channel protein 8 [Jatropha curcas]KDP36863.1 hypothetical protein JCGZ_08154 [Jatropha curcas]
MESLRKSLKAYRFHTKQQQDHPQEEKQALLNNQKDHQMTQSQKEEVVFKIDADTDTASKSGGESSSGKFAGLSKKLKFEDILNVAVRQRNKDLPDQGNSRFTSTDSFRRNSWRSILNKTKSRLIDPPEEQYQRSDTTYYGGDFEEDEDRNEEEEDGVEDIPEEYKKMTFSALTMLQRVILVFVTLALVCSLSIPAIRKQTLWGLSLWKWEIMVMALICGHLVSGWGIKVVVIFIERNYLLRKRVLYFVYGLRKAVQNCLWLGLVLLVWHWIFNKKVEETKSKMLLYVTRILICLFAGTFIWLLKTLIVKVLASSFHVNTFFERIQEALFNQYVIETLCGPPLYERQSEEEEDFKETLAANNRSGRLNKCPTVGKRHRFSRKNDEEILIEHLHKLNQKNISAWNMRRMIKIVRHATFSTLDEQILNSNIEDESLFHIRSECQAKEAAKKIFNKVARPGSQYIFLDDMMRFMGKEEALRAMNQFGATTENEGISKLSLNSWLVNAFRERKALALSLNDTKTAVDELHNMLNILVAIVVMIIWLLILGVNITHFLVFISSQLLLVAFIFGNSCKTTFEAIIFLFIMHPFDVGDRCQVDGVEMIVEEMNILTTVFLRYDKQKITYPNSVLATKPIGNYYRSPDMDEAIDFSIHISTPLEKIAIMKDRIKEYIEGNNDHWHPNANIIAKDLEDMNKINMLLWVTHKLNFQRSGERWSRRTLLVEQMIKVFKELDIEYRLLPLDVNVRNLQPLNSSRLPSNWTTCAN